MGVVVPTTYPHLIFGPFWYPLGAGNARIVDGEQLLLCYTGYATGGGCNDNQKLRLV